MKKRRWHLKKWVQRTLEVITCIGMMFILSINDFEPGWQSIAIIFGTLSVMAFNVYVLKEYGVYND